MNFIQKLRWEAGKIMLRGDMTVLRKPGIAVGFEGASRIGILYDAGVKENYEAVKNFVRRIRNNQKEVKSLGFINSRKLPGDQFIKLGMDFFTLANLNWHFRPLSKVTSNFIKEDFDILINLSMEECVPLDYITHFSRSHFRIGRFSERNKLFYDFMIDLKPKDTIAQFVDQVEHYLQIINSNKKDNTV